MKRAATFVGVIITLLALQGVFVRTTGVRADVAAAAIVYLALERAVLPGAALAAFTGYLSDVFAGTSRGLYASAGVIVFFLLRLSVARLAGSGLLFVSALGALGALLLLGVTLVVEHLIGSGGHRLAGLAPAVPGLFGASVLLSYPVYRLLKRIDERFEEPEDDLPFRS